MVYTIDSSFLSPPVGTTILWADALRAHGADAPEEIARVAFRLGAKIGINADLALAQSVQETGWMTSGHWINQRNCAGLGVAEDGVESPTFASIEDGWKAFYEHLVCYTMVADPPVVREWGMLDPRHSFHDGMPRVVDLVRLGRKWAVPGDGYAAAIVAIGNQVIEGEETAMSILPTEAEIGYPVRAHGAADVGPSRGIGEIAWFIVHDTEGHFIGDEAILTSADPPVESAHALIGRDGTLVAMVPLDRTAWTPGNDDVALRSVNVELSGFATERYTDAQYRSLAAFFRWCVARGMIVPAVYVGKEDRPGICGHQDVADPYHPGAWGGAAHHTDPGPLFAWETLTAYINQTAPAQPGLFYAAGNPLGKIPMAAPFWNRWHTLDLLGLALPMMGYPQSVERTLIDGRRVQRFERGWFGTQGAPDPWNVVALFPAEWPSGVPTP